MANVLTEYLVSLRATADAPSFEKFESLLRNAESGIARYTTGMSKKVIEAQGAIVGAFTGISSAIVGLMDKAAMADLGYAKLSVRMMMSVDSARKYDIITKALGADLNEILRVPELHDRAAALNKDLTRIFGGVDEGKLRGIRDVRFEFTRLEVALQGLGTHFAIDVFSKLFPSGNALDTIQEKVDWFIDHIPELSNKLSDYAVPILKDTWEIMKGLGEAVKTGALAFTNLVGVFSGDSSIESSVFSFDKLAKALEHVAGWFKTIVDWITQAESMLAHFAAGASLLLTGQWKAAGAEFKAGLSAITAGSGGLIGATIGMAAGGPVGAVQGAIIGTGGGSTIATAQDPAARAGVVGGLKAVGSGVLGSLGNFMQNYWPEGKLHEWGKELSGTSKSLWDSGTAGASLTDRLAGAIAAYESGGNPNAINFRNNNPGNLRSWGSMATSGGFAQFPTMAAGLAAEKQQIDKNIARGLTLNEFFGGGKGYGGWAPASDKNKPSAYAAAIARQLGIDPNTPLNQIASDYLNRSAMGPMGSRSAAPVQQQVNLSLGGIYITQPGADVATIQSAVLEAGRQLLKDQVMADLAQMQPAWG